MAIWDLYPQLCRKLGTFEVFYSLFGGMDLYQQKYQQYVGNCKGCRVVSKDVKKA